MIPKDILWKGIIEDLFDDFLRYFLPDLAQNEVDFSKDFEFLDKELDTLLPESQRGKRHADKLVKIFTKAGKPTCVLLHIEVQGYEDENFAERMFEYYYRIRDRWKMPVFAFVLYTNENVQFQPIRFVEQYHQTRLTYEFPTFTLVGKTAQDLEVADNPFSVVMQVAQKALEKKELTDDKQLVWKTELVRSLAQAGFSFKRIRNILKFIRYYVVFQEAQNWTALEQEIETITNPPKPMGIEEAIIEYLKEEAKTEGKAEGKAEGIAEGKAEGKAEGIAEGELKGKKEDVFGMFAEGLSLDAIVRITKLPLETIQIWQQEWQASQEA